MAQQAAGPDAPSGGTPPRSRARRPLGRDSASLEGHAHRRVGLRLARGLDAPSGETPPRSSPVWVHHHGPVTPHPLPRPEH
jgi:hypothetical protein